MATLYSKIEQEMDCPKEIVIWNYFDHEHVVGTHYKSYDTIRIRAEKDNWCLAERSFKLPYIPFIVVSRNFSYLESEYCMKSFHIGKTGLMLVQDFQFKDLGPDRCLVTLESRLEVPGIFKILESLFAKFTIRWFYATWDEDHPMRLRRWKVWKLGFKNFIGIDYINQRVPKPAGRENETRPYPLELPVPKSTNITGEGYKRPFTKSVEVGYEMPPLPL